MPNVNQVAIAGHLGRDAEIKTFQNGGSIAEFSVAVTHSWKNKRTNEWVKETSWLNCKTSNPSDVLRAGLLKGVAVFLTGRIATRKFEHKGEQRTAVEIVADKVSILSHKVDAADAASKPTATPQSAAPPTNPSFDPTNTDDDVPF